VRILILPVIFAPVTAGLLGLLIGWLLSRDTAVAIRFLVVFSLSYVWVAFAMISIQGWGTQLDFGFYWYWMSVIFAPSPLIAGTLASGFLALWWKRTSGDDTWRRSLLLTFAGAMGFGGGALVFALIAARLLATDPTLSSRGSFDLALGLAFYFPLLTGFGVLRLVLVRALGWWIAPQRR
jgi:hypothetical protein